MGRIALYPGSFDPITFGHIDIAMRGLELFDRLVIGIGVNTDKKTLFNIEERIEMIHLIFGDRPRVEIAGYDTLTAKFAAEIGASAILRGLRAISDFEYEFQMTLANRKLYPEAETVFLMPSLENVYLNSSMVKEIARHHGDLRSFVPPPVAQRLKEKFSEFYQKNAE